MSQGEEQQEPPLEEEILCLPVPWSCWIPLEGVGMVAPGVLEVLWQRGLGSPNQKLIPQPNMTALGEADGTAALWDFEPLLPAWAFPLPRSVVG